MNRRTFLCIALLILSTFLLTACSFSSIAGDSPAHSNAENPTPFPSTIPHLINPSETFTAGCYIEISGVQILYDGNLFEIKNNRSDHVRISASIIGIKKDGSYEWLQTPAFYGIDTHQYNKDLQENGWAVAHYTNLIRPGDTLIAEMIITDFSQSGFPSPDIDADGYYDIVFTISPQDSENSTQSSTTDSESEPYKLPAK